MSHGSERKKKEYRKILRKYSIVIIIYIALSAFESKYILRYLHIKHDKSNIVAFMCSKTFCLWSLVNRISRSKCYLFNVTTVEHLVGRHLYADNAISIRRFNCVINLFCIFWCIGRYWNTTRQIFRNFIP